jgi:hypothetical protein
MRAVCLLLALAAAVGTSGCGKDDPEKQVASLMGELREVQESGDAEKACEEVYVVQEPGREPESEEEGEEEEHEGGGERARCEPAFERALEQRKAAVEKLDTKLVRVDVEGDEGTAVLHTNATRTDGSTFERDVPYAVVHTKEGWRVRISPEG